MRCGLQAYPLSFLKKLTYWMLQEMWFTHHGFDSSSHEEVLEPMAVDLVWQINRKLERRDAPAVSDVATQANSVMDGFCNWDF